MLKKENKVKIKYLNKILKNTNKEIRKYKLYKTIDKTCYPILIGSVALNALNGISANIFEQVDSLVYICIGVTAWSTAIYPLIHLFRRVYNDNYRSLETNLDDRIIELVELKTKLLEEKKDIIKREKTLKFKKHNL